MRPVKGLGLFAAFAFSLSLLAFTPAVAAAYTADGGDPSSCAKPSTLVSRTKAIGSGSITVEMRYCAASSVVWARAFNNTGRPAWIATGIERVDFNVTQYKQYDFIEGTCGTFCRDWLANNTNSFGYQLYWPSTLKGVAFKATAYFCGTNQSGPTCPMGDAMNVADAYKVDVVTGPSVHAKIAQLAGNNLGKGPCDNNSLGLTGFISPDLTWSCGFSGRWCAVFAGWVWSNTSHVLYTSTLTNDPRSFSYYGSSHSTQGPNTNIPSVGDAVIFSNQAYPTYSHVGIVYWVDVRTHKATVVAGNEGSNAGTVGVRWYDYTNPGTTYPTSQTYRVLEYDSAVTN